MLRIFFLLLIIVSCSSKPTRYGKYSKKEGGYREKELESGFQVVNFKGNSNTKPSLAERYAQFRAVEICRSKNFKLAHIIDVSNKTKKKTFPVRSTYAYPSYYYGIAPFYGRYSSFGLGFSTLGTTWNETVIYPDIDVVFECASEVYEPVHKLREVSAKEMRHLVKDLKGGLQVEKVSADSSGLKAGDIILYAEGERVQHNYQLLKHFRERPDHVIRVKLLRDGEMKQGLTVEGVDVSEKILSFQEKLISKVCKKKEMKDNKLCKSP